MEIKPATLCKQGPDGRAFDGYDRAAMTERGDGDRLVRQSIPQPGFDIALCSSD